MFERTPIATILVLSPMEPSKSGTSKRTSNHGGAGPSDQARWTETLPRTIRVLLGVETVSFFLAATVHAGVLVRGYEHSEALIAESVLGAVLLGGLLMTWVRPRSMVTVAAGVQGFALLGTLIGIWTIIVGVGPRTVPDIVYHVAIALVLVVGLWVAWRARGTEPV
ncbi:hypothetical protein [Natrinema salifodinae]|nr:hypothetical protein [Natrinema salifodinae]